MSFTGDHDADMAPNWQNDDDLVEAIIGNEAVGDTFAHLALFARSVQAAGEQPPPRASGELVELLVGGQQPQPHPARPARRSPSSAGRQRRSKRRYRVPVGIAALGGKVASLGLASKAAAATGAMTLGTLTAGAAGMAPAPVNDAVQGAISTVTPFNVGDTDDVDAGVDVGRTAGVDADADADSGADAGAGASTDDVTGTATGAVDDVAGTAGGAVAGATGTAEGVVGGVLDQANEVPVAGEVLPDEVPPLPGVPAVPALPGVPPAPVVPPAEAGVGAQASR